MECIFCKIVKEEIPSMKVYEDESTLVLWILQKMWMDIWWQFQKSM